MFNQIKKLFTDSVIYGFGYVASRVITFLLLPFYTNTLSRAEYGIIAMGFFFAGIAKIVYKYGMDSALLRNFELAETIQAKRRIFSTSFWSITLTSLVFSTVIILTAHPASVLLFDRTGLSIVMVLLSGVIYFDCLSVLPQTLLRIQERPVYYVSVSFVNVTVTLGLNIYFVGYLQQGVVGVFKANILASMSMFVVLLPALVKMLQFRFSAVEWKELFSFGLPLIPAGLASMVMELIDRPILKEFTDLATVGLYNAGYKLGIFMMLVVSAFYFAWQPFFMKVGQQDNGPDIFARIFTYFIFLLGGLFITLTVLLDYIVAIPLPGIGPLLGPEFVEALPIVPVIFAAYIMYGAYINFLPGVYLEKRSGKLAIYTVSGAAVNIAGNLILIPLTGIIGAATATLAGYATMALLLYRANRQLYPVPYQWKKVGTTAIITLILWGGFAVLPSTVLIRLLLILAYLGLHLLMGFVKFAELKMLVSRLRNPAGE